MGQLAGAETAPSAVEVIIKHNELHFTKYANMRQMWYQRTTNAVSENLGRKALKNKIKLRDAISEASERLAVRMKLSVIIATRNRAYAIADCLDSVAAAFAYAAPLDAEIVVVDNGSTDDTAGIINAWAASSAVRVHLLFEPKAGLPRAHNRALRAARGEILAFTDDDCRLSKEYVTDLLRHNAGDIGLVLRGGRVELGDPTDLPLTINTSQFSRVATCAEGSMA